MMPTTRKPLTDERWLDFWRHFKGLDHQVAAVIKLGHQIRQADKELLCEGAEWTDGFRTEASSWASIRELAAQAGARHPDLVAAQWALESGWGTAMSGRNNPFGLKGPGTVKRTTEVINGARVHIDAEFKDFPSIKAAVEYLVSRWYEDFIDTRGRTHQGVNRAASRDEAARLLVKEGYATDPDYAQKLIRLMGEHSPAQAAVSGDLDPRSSDEVGLAGPNMKAPVRAGDSYLLVNDRSQAMRGYDHAGRLLWTIPALARGQGADNEWRKRFTDTPPGLYKIGKVYADYDQNPRPARSDTAMSYGWYSFDMEDLEGQEARNGRAGIMLHGGGTAAGWPGAWAPRQRLFPTLGCIRIENIELRDKVLPLVRQGTVYIGVFQER
jgi:hypothetical protein